ncbi:MAG: bifunctional phosphoribosylaminoimidazolecarboxamide formyltransferase/IMP cyclohydrolase, partial [Phycisphaerales bacterium]|nr:bifunctional phosphoribosylaminoimidazolecarboxamide formyltransferase/IMP cyclohydrolase [Phycisphaerales bacterium]
MPDLVPVRSALFSVSDKTDLIPFATALVHRGVRLISTGGTAKVLVDAGLPVVPVDKVTGFPEGLDGRVKTLHPAVHGGLLAVRDNPDHAAFLKRHGIDTIDLVCINLYPFQRTIAAAETTPREAIEQIDVGGPAMVRAASKNYQWVAPVVAPKRYDRVVSELEAHNGSTTLDLRSQLAAEAFALTAEYDAAIAAYLSRRSPAPFPEVLRLTYTKADDLRYGENPHQQAALYRDPASTGQTVVNARQLHGKQLSYNNINDAAAALELVLTLKHLDPSCVGVCIVKHTNPCGAAIAAG